MSFVVAALMFCGVWAVGSSGFACWFGLSCCGVTWAIWWCLLLFVSVVGYCVCVFIWLIW